MATSRRSNEDANRRVEAAAAVQSTARDLAANILRVVRGTGRPLDLVGQAADFVAAAQEFRAVIQGAPSTEIARALCLTGHRISGRRSSGEFQIALGEVSAVGGALQIAASELLGQPSQIAHGRNELYAGIREIRAGHAVNRLAAASSLKVSPADSDTCASLCDPEKAGIVQRDAIWS